MHIFTHMYIHYIYIYIIYIYVCIYIYAHTMYMYLSTYGCICVYIHISVHSAPVVSAGPLAQASMWCSTGGKIKAWQRNFRNSGVLPQPHLYTRTMPLVEGSQLCGHTDSYLKRGCSNCWVWRGESKRCHQDCRTRSVICELLDTICVLRS